MFLGFLEKCGKNPKIVLVYCFRFDTEVNFPLGF